MGFLRRIADVFDPAIAEIPQSETRAGNYDALIADPYWQNFSASRSYIGVTADNVLSNLAVAARCVALRSELLASVGLFLYRRTDDGGRERADDNPLYGVLHDQANPNMSAFEAREFLTRSLDTAGNAYANIEVNARGQVSALYPIAPGTVTVEKLQGGRLRYRVTDDNGTRVYLQDEILHVRGPSRDGLIGQSPIQIARGALRLAMGQQETAQSITDNAMRPSGAFIYPNYLTIEQQQLARKAADQRFAGASNAGRIMILDGGVTFEKLSFSPEDAEFLDSRKLSNEDVARIFGLPPTSVGITDKATYSNTEQEARALVQNALGPLAKRLEAAMARCLLTPAGRRSLYVEHELDTLLRGDVAARFEAYRIGREIGVYSPNDIRRKENEPPLPNGNIYNQPQNWAPLGSMPQPAGAS